MSSLRQNLIWLGNPSSLIPQCLAYSKCSISACRTKVSLNWIRCWGSGQTHQWTQHTLCCMAWMEEALCSALTSRCHWVYGGASGTWAARHPRQPVRTEKRGKGALSNTPESEPGHTTPLAKHDENINGEKHELLWQTEPTQIVPPRAVVTTHHLSHLLQKFLQINVRVTVQVIQINGAEPVELRSKA